MFQVNTNLKLQSLTFGKYNISFRLCVDDKKYSFIKFFKMNITYDRNYMTKLYSIGLDYGIYGKSNKKLFVNETSFGYEYDTVLKYVQPLLDNFCKDKI